MGMKMLALLLCLDQCLDPWILAQFCFGCAQNGNFAFQIPVPEPADLPPTKNKKCVDAARPQGGTPRHRHPTPHSPPTGCKRASQTVAHKLFLFCKKGGIYSFIWTDKQFQVIVIEGYHIILFFPKNTPLFGSPARARTVVCSAFFCADHKQPKLTMAPSNDNSSNPQAGLGRPLPKKEADLFKNVVKHYEMKMYKKATKQADTILKKYPNHGETLAMKGLIMNCLSKRDEAHVLVKQGLMNDMRYVLRHYAYSFLHKLNNGSFLTCNAHFFVSLLLL
jgi:hypothetical protein